MGLELISKAIEIDNKCDFAYETMGTIEVQRFVMLHCFPFFFSIPNLLVIDYIETFMWLLQPYGFSFRQLFF